MYWPATRNVGVGILLQGLWLTLKVSLVAIIFGTILGLFTGLARIAQNPALRWGAVTYIEIVRGSPLLVQILIWYFVFGTLINSPLSSGLSAHCCICFSPSLSFNFFPHKSVEDNLILAQRVVRKRSKSDALKKAHMLLEKVGIKDKARVFPG
jgi:His/Glu/Gln/Arg/opine family amino acid ABC transporter permease subunit